MLRKTFMFLTLLICFDCLMVNGDGSVPKAQTRLHDKNFAMKLLNDLQNQLELLESSNFDEFLNTLNVQLLNETLREELKIVVDDNTLPKKIVFMKQYLDVVKDDDPAYDILLHNVNFSEKLYRKLIELEIKTAQDLRLHRMYKMCRQFRKTQTLSKKKRSTLTVDGGSRPNGSEVQFSLEQFGEEIYGRVKAEGAEIIDGYLTELHKLLEEVVDDTEEISRKSSQLDKVLMEIEYIVNTTDFYEKRQKLYLYLQENLANDYEQFNDSEHAQQNIAKILTTLKSRGLDLFVTFLFSNFEFLEDLFEIWQKTLSTVNANDSKFRLVSDILRLYKEFKEDSQSSEKYSAYMEKAAEIHQKGPQHGNAAHIFELLNNASQNIGTVTMNMIRSKCEEF